jgi:hypothetical protein
VLLPRRPDSCLRLQPLRSVPLQALQHFVARGRDMPHLRRSGAERASRAAYGIGAIPLGLAGVGRRDMAGTAIQPELALCSHRAWAGVVHVSQAVQPYSAVEDPVYCSDCACNFRNCRLGVALYDDVPTLDGKAVGCAQAKPIRTCGWTGANDGREQTAGGCMRPTCS